jgi:dihydroxyacetone kinase-like predicted kinase
MGARGNSGVITSQIFRGFAKALEGKKRNQRPRTRRCLHFGQRSRLQSGHEAGRRHDSHGHPRIFGRLKRTHQKRYLDRRSDGFLAQEAEASLAAYSGSYLPILKEVGVVDSGGAGLASSSKAWTKPPWRSLPSNASDVGSSEEPSSILAEVPMYAGAKLTEDEEGYGYCTQFIVRLGKPGEGKKPFIEKKFQNFLATHGKSLVLVRDDDIVKVHVHTSIRATCSITPRTMANS